MSDKKDAIQFCVRERWDTGAHEYFMETLEEAIDLRTDIVVRLGKTVPMDHKQAAKFVDIYAMVRMDV